MKCYIGLDIGTSAVKGVLLSRDGKVLAERSGQFEYYSENSAKLMDPARFLEACFDVIKNLAEYPDAEVAAICPSGASGNLILLDEDFSPLIPIIGWQSKHDENESSAYFTEEEREALYRKIGWRVGNGFPLVHLMWMKKNIPELIGKSKMICMHIEYLNFALCGRFGISHSMGTPFYLMDQDKGTYNKVLLEKLGIDESVLPPIYDKGHILGNVTEETAKKLNLGKNTKVALGTFDHPAGALGAGVFDEGEMLLSCGTSWVELFPVESRAKAFSAGALTDRYMLSGSPYCVMCSLESVSEKIAKYRAYFFEGLSFADFDTYAEKAMPGCNGLRFDLSCEDYEKAGGFSKSDIARAIIESAAFILAENLSDMETRGFLAEKIRIIGGITNSPVCVRIISETLGRDILVVNGVSAGAVGSAMLAGIGVGDFENEKACFDAMKFQEIKY